LLIAGSFGKIGAAVLAAEASLKSGAGLIHCHLPGKGYEIMQITNPEVMISVDDSDEHFSYLPDISKYNAIAAGPGLGTNEDTARALKLIIQNTTVPLIFDADALNILSENKTWLSFLPSGSILTPHPKEFERLAGKWSDDFEKLKMQKDFAFKHQCYLLLKGAYSSLATPEGKIFFNSTGNPGMATAGSGDVLTGMLLGLMAQGYTSLEAGLTGMYLHGLAGDIASKSYSQQAMVAGDIIKNIGNAYKRMLKKKLVR
jgi:NAD(P)H-hydrate epimerase